MFASANIVALTANENRYQKCKALVVAAVAGCICYLTLPRCEERVKSDRNFRPVFFANKTVIDLVGL